MSTIADADLHYEDGKKNELLDKAQTILLIDDNIDIIENLAEFLEMEGYKILVANNGGLGVELARKFIPDLIICDVLMPEMDGYEVLRLLLDTAQTQAIPFIFSTSMSEKIDRKESLKLGADDYIVKPFELEALLAIIKKWVSTGSQKTR
ncbi:MAG: response regulator [Bacteroidia bacterium]|nr:response regulator [Bacteroidia bacterium]